MLALTPCAILILRAAHDPALNEGDPTTWSAVWEVVGRRQYGDFALWPRHAPLWLQAAQFFEYMDWQVALSLAPRAAPAVARTAVTLAFLGLGAAGCRAHRRADRRSWRALVTLFACASVGLVLYLNFNAGYSLGYGLLPEGTAHEVRERDYFFALAFWTWGAWVGVGAVGLASRIDRRLVPAGVAIAALPVALNWRAMDLARGVGRDGARTVARALLWGAPRDAVLVAVGDHDTFLLWYAQIVEGARPDVTVASAPLLYADWYDAELARRHGLDVHSTGDPLHALADAARRRGRPLAIAITADSGTRAALGGAWMLRGLTFVPADSSGIRPTPSMPAVDSAAAAAFVREFGVPALPPEDAIDGSPRSMIALVRCPAAYLAIARGAVAADSLASSCNLR